MRFQSQDPSSARRVGALLAAGTVAVPALAALAFPAHSALIVALALALPFVSMTVLEGLTQRAT